MIRVRTLTGSPDELSRDDRAVAIQANQPFIDQVMKLWDARCDTLEIAQRLYGADRAKLKEAVICVALRIGREQRRTT